MAAAKRAGRPTLYTEELALDICARIASGETLIEICDEYGYPEERTVRGWDIANVEGFSTLYARARALQIEHEIDENKVISNRPEIGIVTVTKEIRGKDGEVQTLTETREGDMLGHRQLKIRTREYRIEKLAANKYGPRAAVELSGPRGGPIETKSTSIVGEMTPQQAAEAYADSLRGDVEKP